MAIHEVPKKGGVVRQKGLGGNVQHGERGLLRVVELGGLDKLELPERHVR